MHMKIPYRRKFLCAAIPASLLPLAGTTIAQQDTIEEVIVTGSYIRRTEGFTQASSIVQLTAEDLEALLRARENSGGSQCPRTLEFLDRMRQ